MKKLILCISLVCVGFLSSCVEKNELVDEEQMPSWLGSSIYGELSNPDPGKGLTGTFKTYLRLVDDLGYAETLNRTGSNTVFPANDEAFERFFASNDWGVSSYEELSNSQKKMLLYSSMLNNAILIELLSNVSSDDGVVSGDAVKHSTALNVIDTVTTYPFASALSVYGERNPFWTSHANGISVVSDATRPMLVHFTRNYMLKNSITTSGENSDFAVISGGSYENENDAYIFGNRVTAPDVTCQNGYIHQVQDVVTPPGNMAQLIKRDPNLSIFSHVLDRFAMPVYNDDITQQFHDWYVEQSAVTDMSGVYNPDSIYEVRYLSKSSRGGSKFSGDARSGGVFQDDYLLTFDPGWNEYYVPSLQGTISTELSDIAAMFVPDNDAMVKYFTEDPSTKTLLDTYGSLPNTPENVMRNLEDVPLNILAKFVSNLMNTSFASSVPSKFGSVVDDAKDAMGIELTDIKTKDGGGYDVRIANNGVVYVMNKVFGPKAYGVVSAPALFSSNTDMGMANWIIQNVSYNNNYPLGIDYYAFLISTSANYALFLPTKDAFDAFYLDPTSLSRTTGKEYIHYYIDNVTTSLVPLSGIGASIWRENGSGGLDSVDVLTIDTSDPNFSTTTWPMIKSHLAEIIQMSTIVLDENETLQSGYYLTQNGAGIKVEGSGNFENGRVLGGGQLVNGLEAPVIGKIYNQSNGTSYAINHLIQGTTRSVYSYLSQTPRFSEFFELCNGFDNTLMSWAGISTTASDIGTVEADQYTTFYIPGSRNAQQTDQQLRCPDQNVRFFSNYDYTLYAPDNDAVEVAKAHGLPTWDDVEALFTKWGEGTASAADDEEADKAKAKTMIKAIRDFVRYHFHSNSVYASGTFSGSSSYSTFLVNEDTHINEQLSIAVDNAGKITITDGSESTTTVDPASTSTVANEMTRDMEFAKNRTLSGNYVSSSSYAVIHELTQPLFYYKSKDFSQGLTE